MGRLFACFRCCLVIGTVLLGISGAIVTVFAGYFIYQLYEYAPVTPNNVCESAAVLLAMGFTTCCIGWFAWQFLNFYNRAQVITFAVALGTIALVETCVGIWALVRHEQIDTLLPEQHDEIFALAVSDEKAIWDHMQSTLQCCGIDGPNDYRNVQAIPWSCCNKSLDLVDNNNTENICGNIYKRGCQHVVLNRTRSILLHIFLLALCSVLLQISFMACMTCYARIYKDKMRSQLEVTRRQRNVRESRNNDTLLEDKWKRSDRL